MPKFAKKNIPELKRLLRNSYVHDAKIEEFRYLYGADKIKIRLFNPNFNVKIDLTFYGIEFVLAIKKEDHGDFEAVISLTAEDDFSYLLSYLSNQKEYKGEFLYILFQMLSGNEFHIISKEVTVEQVQKTGDGSVSSID